MARAPKGPKQVGTLNHPENRRNIPTAEMADLAAMQEELDPLDPIHYPRARPLAEGQVRERDDDLDPQIVWNGTRVTLTKAQVEQLVATGCTEIGDAQLVWRGKDRQDWSDLIVTAPMIHTQEKVHPKVIIDDLVRRSKEAREEASDAPDLFADFNGLDDPMARTEFYQHDMHWQNRMILGDSLQVMASLAEREALKGKVQAIYFDPPYGIKFGSNWQVSTQSRDVKDGKQESLSREPEQVKAFRDTWKDGIHSYLTYLRDRLTVMRELLTECGSIFVQIGDENVHRVRTLMDEVFGAENFVNEITVLKTTGVMATTSGLHSGLDYVLWYGKTREIKFREPFQQRSEANAGSFSKVMREDGTVGSAEDNGRLFRFADLLKSGPGAKYEFQAEGKTFSSGAKWWGTPKSSMERLVRANRVKPSGKFVYFVSFEDDFPIQRVSNLWTDTTYLGERYYVVQTGPAIVQRCLLMTTDPGDLVLDPTCGSGTTAYVAEQWGRRWITIDTSRVALALARTRLMAARYPWYLLADSPEGKRKEAEITGRPPNEAFTHGDIRQGFVYERVPHIMQSTVGNNVEIDVIWEKYEPQLGHILKALNRCCAAEWQEWEVPRQLSSRHANTDPEYAVKWMEREVALYEGKRPSERFRTVQDLHEEWWNLRIARQAEIDASIARAADVDYLYDKPYADSSRVRVAGPFTVESLSPHRIVPADDELIHAVDAAEGKLPRAVQGESQTDFAAMVLDHLKSAGVHQIDRGDRISFTSVMPWPGEYIGAEARFMEGEAERRAAIFIGPEFGTVSRVQLTAAAREASESRFDVLIAVSFAFDAHAMELSRLGPLPVLKAKMNPDLHMADDLKNTGKGNLFTIFGEPDIDIIDQPDGRIVVKVNGVDIYDPNTGEVRSNDVKGIAAWFIDTAYNEESFFVRHAYFLGANDPYKQLKTSLKAEIDEDAWATLYRDTSRPFDRPKTGRIAVKVINHFGDEVMKVFGV